MPLKLKLFTLKYDPALDGFDDSCVQRFLSDKNLVRSAGDFFTYEGVPHFFLFLEYSTGAEIGGERKGLTESRRDTDHTAGFDEGQRRLYDTLRGWRTEKAKEEGIPVFLIASNRMLAEVVLQGPGSLQELRGIDGFGAGKVRKFGAELLGMLPAEKETDTDE